MWCNLILLIHAVFVFLNHVYAFLFQKTSNFSLGQMELKMVGN